MDGGPIKLIMSLITVISIGIRICLRKISTLCGTYVTAVVDILKEVKTSTFPGKENVNNIANNATNVSTFGGHCTRRDPGILVQHPVRVTLANYTSSNISLRNYIKKTNGTDRSKVVVPF